MSAEKRPEELEGPEKDSRVGSTREILLKFRCSGLKIERLAISPHKKQSNS